MITDGLNRVTNYEAADYYLPTSITRPAGDKDIFIYQGGGMITQVVHKAQPNSGLADTTESATYPASCTSKFICNKPTSYTDRSGKTTFYDYASEHGGLLTENLPADANGIRSVKRYRYAQRYAWILNGSGGYMKAATPVWLKTEERTCRTSSTVNDACGGGAADEVVTTFDYGADAGPNNLLLRSMAVASGGQTLRTCLTYDAKGNKLSETKPLGTGSGCP